MKPVFKRVLINVLTSIYMLPLYISLLFILIATVFPMETYRVITTLILVAMATYYLLRIYMYLKLGVFQKTRYIPRLLVRLKGFSKGFLIFLLIASVIGLVEPYIARFTNVTAAWFISTVLTIIMIYVLRAFKRKIKLYILGMIALIMIISQYLLGVINESSVKNAESLLKLLEEVLHGG